MSEAKQVYQHHPHYNNHRSPVHKSNIPTSVGAASGVVVAGHRPNSPATSGSNIPIRQRSQDVRGMKQQHGHHHQQNVHNAVDEKPKRFEAFMMTGDLIINLAHTESNDNLVIGRYYDPEARFRRRRHPTMTKNESTMERNLRSLELDDGRGENLMSFGSTAGEGDAGEGQAISTSLPTSPMAVTVATSTVGDVADEVLIADSSKDEGDQSQASSILQSQATQTAVEADQGSPRRRNQQTQTPSSNVRLSKSEDHLLSGSLALMENNGSIYDDNQSNSLDTLMNDSSKGNGRRKSGVESSASSTTNSSANVCSKAATSTSSSSSNSSSPTSTPVTATTSTSTTTTTTSSTSSASSSPVDEKKSAQLATRSNSLEDYPSSSLDTSSCSACCAAAGASISGSGSASFTATNTSVTTPPELNPGLSSITNSPTKAVSGTNTLADQTESSMSEGYSVISSLSGVGCGALLGRHHHHHRNNNNINHNHHQGNPFLQAKRGQCNASNTQGALHEPSNRKQSINLNTLSLSSSCGSDDDSCSSATASPQDDTAAAVAHPATKLIAQLKNRVGYDHSAGSSTIDDVSCHELDSPNKTSLLSGSSAGSSPRVLHKEPEDTSKKADNENESGVKRYPSFISTTLATSDGADSSNTVEPSSTSNTLTVEEQISSIGDDETLTEHVTPPPTPQYPPPSSSSEGDSSEEDVDSLHSYHYSPPKQIDLASASRLAKRLFNLEGFKKSDVSRHLSKNNDFSRVVAAEYLKLFEFAHDTLDCALRKFLAKFCLIGETQERERVLMPFSKRYLDCNVDSFKSTDAVHTLTCAIMLLNSDLHGENVGRKMTCAEFVENLDGLNDMENYPRDVLRQIYQSIKSEPLKWAMDDEMDDAQAQSDKNRVSSLVALPAGSGASGGSGSTGSQHLVVGSNPFVDVPNPNAATEFKKGYIMRKCCFDSNGKRTPLGKRGWKMFYATLRDLVLYLHKDEQGFRKNQLYESLHNSIRIHHSVAAKATDYTKKQFVFRLLTADCAEYLFQTSDARELQSWIDTINLVASSLSSPPLPSAVGSQTKKFQRPLLPVSHTKLNMRDQLHEHETRLYRLESELEDHMCKAPDRTATRRALNEFAEKESYLQHEVMKYKLYDTLLRAKVQSLSQHANADKNSSLRLGVGPKSQPLTTLAIGEESSDLDLNDDESDKLNSEPIIKHVKSRHGYKQNIYTGSTKRIS